MEQLEEKGTVRVTDLSQALRCSEVTIRNDLTRLEESGVLKRTHGGAVKRKEQLTLRMESGNGRNGD